MEKKCPYCGAPLPEEASFCPHCAKSINRRSQPQKPLLIPVKVLRGILLCGVLAVLAGVLYLSTRPQTVEGMGEVYYTDDDGTPEGYFLCRMLSHAAYSSSSVTFSLRRSFTSLPLNPFL